MGCSQDSAGPGSSSGSLANAGQGLGFVRVLLPARGHLQSGASMVTFPGVQQERG